MHPTISDLLRVEILQLIEYSSGRLQDSHASAASPSILDIEAPAGFTNVASVRAREGTFSEDDRLEIVITYSNSVFSETAYGLKHALETLQLNYARVVRVVVWGDMHHVFESTGSDDGSNRSKQKKRIQIAIAPHEETMILPTYIVLHMEQAWSDIAMDLSYMAVLVNAAAIWTFSHALKLHLLSLSLPVLLDMDNVHIVPVYTDPDMFISEHELLSIADTHSYANLIPLGKDGATEGIDHGIEGTTGKTWDVSNNEKFSTLSKKYAVSFFGSHSNRRASILIPLMQRIMEETNAGHLFGGGFYGTVPVIGGEARNILVAQSKVHIQWHY